MWKREWNYFYLVWPVLIWPVLIWPPKSNIWLLFFFCNGLLNGAHPEACRSKHWVFRCRRSLPACCNLQLSDWVPCVCRGRWGSWNKRNQQILQGRKHVLWLCLTLFIFSSFSGENLSPSPESGNTRVTVCWVAPWRYLQVGIIHAPNIGIFWIVANYSWKKIHQATMRQTTNTKIQYHRPFPEELWTDLINQWVTHLGKPSLTHHIKLQASLWAQRWHLPPEDGR